MYVCDGRWVGGSVGRSGGKERERGETVNSTSARVDTRRRRDAMAMNGGTVEVGELLALGGKSRSTVSNPLQKRIVSGSVRGNTRTCNAEKERGRILYRTRLCDHDSIILLRVNNRTIINSARNIRITCEFVWS